MNESRKVKMNNISLSIENMDEQVSFGRLDQ